MLAVFSVLRRRVPMSVTVEDLKSAPSVSFLFCPDCGDRYSATYGDYF
jgi:hypothetical protein